MVERIAPHARMTTRYLVLVLVLALTTTSLGLIARRVYSYPPFRAMPGALADVFTPVALLGGSILVALVATRRGSTARDVAVSIGASWGIGAGLVEVLHITQENFVDLGAAASSWITVLVMLALCALWGAAGYRTARRTRLRWGIFAGSWSALIGMLIAATYGLILLNVILSRLEQRNIGSPDLLRSHWTDLRAFTIADLLEAVVKVLVVGPVLGAVFGAIGGALAGARRRVIPLS